MKKADLVEMITNSTEVSKAAAERLVDEILTSVMRSVASNETVDWAGFGKFERTERAARKGRNPQTGAEIQIAASKGVKFKPAKAFKDKVNQ